MKERRQFHRVTLQASFKYRRAGSLMELWHTGALINLGAGGLRFTADDLFEKDTQLELEITLPIRNDPYVLIGFVVAETRSAAGNWDYSIAFENVTPDKQVEIDELVQFLMKVPGKP